MDDDCNVEQSDSKLKKASQENLDHTAHIVDGPYSLDRLSRPSTVINSQIPHSSLAFNWFSYFILVISFWKIIEARTDAKAESQYFFSSNTTKFFADVLRQQHVTGVLCIGCPRLHEYLLTNTPNLATTGKNYPLHSMLLDFDARYVSTQ